MAVLQWNRLVGQERIKNVLGKAFENGTLGHAYLFCGEKGTGKFAAALELAMALLCHNEEKKPCGVCPSCKKVNSYSHPDFHVLMPVVLGKEHKTSDGKLSPDGWNYVSSRAARRIENPYRLEDFSGIPQIPVEWIKEVNHAIVRGSVESGRNVAILDGVDFMNKESANAMLKTLEEPPPGTVMILLTNRAHSVLQTIVSRCQILRFSFLSPDVIRSELCSRFNVDSSDTRVETAVHCGSLGEAVAIFENPPDESYRIASEFWNHCVSGDWESVAADIDRCGDSADQASGEKTLQCLLQLLRFAFLAKFPGSVNYFRSDMPYRIELPGTVTPGQMEHLVRLCQDALSALKARGNSQLVLVNFACSLMEIYDVKKQQAC
ncbi:MAG: ATP-binding protein [Chitinispirillaceae bacterium]